MKEAFTPSTKEVEKVVYAGKEFSIPGVSLLRLSYTNASTCKQHAKQILNPNAPRPEVFAGLMLFKSQHIEELCCDETAKALKVQKVVEEAPVMLAHGTPMDDTTPDPKYIPEGALVYTDTPGNPMHADLIYNFPRPEKGVPNNPINKLAKLLLDKGVHKFDNTGNPEVWGGDSLTLD